MIELTLSKYAEPDYFQGLLEVDGNILLSFYFSSANTARLDDANHISFFAADNDTTLCIELTRVVMNQESGCVLAQAVALCSDHKDERLIGGAQ